MSTISTASADFRPQEFFLSIGHSEGLASRRGEPNGFMLSLGFANEAAAHVYVDKERIPPLTLLKVVRLLRNELGADTVPGEAIIATEHVVAGEKARARAELARAHADLEALKSMIDRLQKTVDHEGLVS